MKFLNLRIKLSLSQGILLPMRWWKNQWYFSLIHICSLNNNTFNVVIYFVGNKNYIISWKIFLENCNECCWIIYKKKSSCCMLLTSDIRLRRHILNRNCYTNNIFTFYNLKKDKLKLDIFVYFYITFLCIWFVWEMWSLLKLNLGIKFNIYLYNVD